MGPKYALRKRPAERTLRAPGRPTADLGTALVMAENIPIEPDLDDLFDQVRALQKQVAADQELVAELQAKIVNLEAALVTARRIGAAVGILMDRYKLTDRQAFTLLETASMRTHHKLRDLADQLVETGAMDGLDEHAEVWVDIARRQAG